MAKSKCTCKKRGRVGAAKTGFWGWVPYIGGGVLLFALISKANATPTTPPTPPTPPNNGGGSGSGTGSGGGSGSGSNNLLDVDIQPNTPISSANTATKRQIQTDINALFDQIRNVGSPPSMWWSNSVSLPANLVVDGNIGTKSKEAIQYLYAWTYNLNNAIKKSNTAVNVDINSLTISNIRFSINIVKAAL